MPLIEVTNLVKVFNGDVRAVDGISFHVDQGEVFGFLGPNGAGKTTTIRVLVTLLQATSGSASVDGLDVAASPNQVRQRIGYAAQFIGIDGDLTARENLILQGRLHGLSKAAVQKEADHLLEVIDLTEVADRRANTFSGGMRRRLDLAQALVHRPRILFLDEPTTGLDPQNRHALWEYLRQLNAGGVTIFLTTQYLEEADALTSRIAIIDQGRIVVEGTPDALKAGIGGDTITVTIDEHDIERAAGALNRLGAVDHVQLLDHSVIMTVADGGSRVAEVVRALDAAGVTLHQLELAEPSLDQVFLKHTGDRLRVDEVTPPSRIFMGRRSR
jgi:daunorubicin resistance ABC transporter ATP-binding subunit